MTRKIVRSIVFAATLLVGFAAVARAQDDGICSTAGMAGEWGYTSTGTLIVPTGSVPLRSSGDLPSTPRALSQGCRTVARGGAKSAWRRPRGLLP